MSTSTPSPSQVGPSPTPLSAWRSWLLPALLGVALLWSFALTLAQLGHRWTHETQYSHGYLVPIFAAVLLWLRREKCTGLTPGFSWGGLGLLVLALGLRFVGEFLYFEWLDEMSLLFVLAALAVLFGGRAALRWSWPAIAFLAFMVPLPFSAERALTLPLQRVGTVASTYALQTLGLPALSEGNIILLHEYKIGVVEACSGLSMLVIFFALSTAVALYNIKRPGWQRWTIVVSAIPIALIANITRITVTGVMFATAGAYWANLVFHDLAGWLMMPFALVLLWLELKMLNRLFVEVTVVKPALGVPGGKPLAGGVPGYKAKNRRQLKKDIIIPPLPQGPRKP